MAGFPGGSAWATAKDVADGYMLVTERTFGRFDAGQLEKLAFELERALRDVRGDQPPLDDLEAIQVRNRKITRLNGALTMLRSYQQRRFRPKGKPTFDGHA
ncbi:MAG: hypothetical protein NDJ75_09630 [Thermoanaerobaculia bacterium]|nr:hypothetical protein [Thermoanaerobaculia bacterium]